MRLGLCHLLHPPLVRHLLPLAAVGHVLRVRLGTDQVAAPLANVSVRTFRSDYKAINARLLTLLKLPI